MTGVDPNGLQAARSAIKYLSHPETPWTDEQVAAVITAYLAALTPLKGAPVAYVDAKTANVVPTAIRTGSPFLPAPPISPRRAE